MIYLLLRREIKLAKCQSLFIIKLSISDVIVSILGVFRGLGIIDSRFVGAVNNTATPYCAAYTIFMYSFGDSGMMALLPLTLDRVIAVIAPLKHDIIVTKRFCFLVFSVIWLMFLGLLAKNIVGYHTGTISIYYYSSYYRCVMTGLNMNIQNLCLFIIPFFSILFMYAIILSVIIKSRRSVGRFLLIVTLIAVTNLTAYTSSMVLDIWNVQMSYETAQILTVTFWYTNGIMNPLIYVATHPQTRKYVVDKWIRKSLRSTRTSAAVETITITGPTTAEIIENPAESII